MESSKLKVRLKYLSIFIYVPLALYASDIVLNWHKNLINLILIIIFQIGGLTLIFYLFDKFEEKSKGK